VTELTMPKLSDSMEQGTILTWLKANGERVQAGDDLLEIETDKATVTHQAESSGTLTIIAPEGETLPVGAPIARIGAAVDGADADGVPARPDADDGGPAGAEPTPSRAAEANGREPAAGVAAAEDAGNSSGTMTRATPLARRVAKAHGIALDDVTGSGPLGRVTRGDVLAKAGIAPDPAPAPTPAPRAATPPRTPTPASTSTSTGESPEPSGRGTVEVAEPTRLQSVIARRMAEAKATIPHFQVQTEVVMDAVIAFRQQIADTGQRAPSVNDLIVKAAALALREHPHANASYRDGHFERYSRVNVGIAVAAQDALVVPTIFDADKKSLGAIAAESRRLAERVRDATVTPAELSGATFTVSNLGMYGMTAIAPVINPPQSAILGVGAVRDVLARVDGEIVDRHLMTVTLSCDHRILYGADAAQFLVSIRELLEAPIRLVL
jgi:pyruvate dehydrogenase E2 component (dihydrolipoamide acetyltransferase)